MKNTKKALIIVLCLCLVAALAACAGNKEQETGTTASTTQKQEEAGSELSLSVENTVENYADFSLFKITTGKKVTASMDGGIYYENKNAGETYVDVVLDLTNTSANAIESESIVALSAVNSAGVEYKCNLYAVETDNSTSLSQYESIAPLSKVRIHCAVSVPENETDLTLNLAVNGKIFSCAYNVGEAVSNVKVIKAGEEIEEEDFAKMVFKGIEYTSDLLPSNTNGAYSHYEVDNKENVYLVARFDITNYASSDKKCDTFAGVKATYMDKYTYTGFVVVEDEDEKGFSSYESVSPLMTRHFYYLIEVPKTVSSNPVTLTISFNGQEYAFTGK